MRISNGNFLDEDGNEVNLVELLRTGKATPVVNNNDGHHMNAHSGWFTDENGTPVNIVALIDAAIDEDGGDDEPAIAEAVSDWLNEHPEATTTVQDESLTATNFTAELRLKSIKDYVTPEMHGAKGDGETDDTSAFQSAVDYCRSNGKMLYLPVGSVYNIPNLVTFKGVNKILAYGTIVAPNGVQFEYYSTQTKGTYWHFGKVNGELVVAGLKASIVDVLFATKLTLFADSALALHGSMAYNTFNLGCVTTLHLHGISKGWINENYFYGGRINTLLVDGGYAHNNNHFYHNSFEDCDIHFYVGRSNYIHNARFEGSPNITFEAPASNNYVHRSWQGETLPGRNGVLTGFKDLSGNNYFGYGIYPWLTVHELKYTAFSNNYDANRIYPGEDGKLHFKNISAVKRLYNDDTEPNTIFESEIFSIEHGVGVNITTKAANGFLRGVITFYDANGELITTKPSVSPLYGTSLNWSDAYHGHNISTSIATFRISLSRHAIVGGADSNICYAKIRLTGYNGATVDFLSIKITAPWYAEISPFGQKRLVSAMIPEANVGAWKDGTIVYNIGTSEQCVGWLYRNGTWHSFGQFT